MPDRRYLDAVLASKRSEIPRLAEIVRQFGSDNQLSVDDIMRIRLVLDEVVVNIVAHGYEDAGDSNHHDIHIHLGLDARDVLTIRVTDDARDTIRGPRRRRDSTCPSRSVEGAAWASISSKRSWTRSSTGGLTASMS